MDVKKENTIKGGEEGQALLEFLAFLPFIIVLYLITITLGGSIFGSINQQKSARGYLYSRIKHNSFLPKPGYGGDDSGAEVWRSWRSFGTYFIGWKERFEGAGSPMASCYKLKLPTKDIENECKAYSKEAAQYIRVMTVYGICGATYQVVDGQNVYHSPYASPGELASVESCTITQ